MYFLANDDKKVATFFTLTGPKVFCLARDLLYLRKAEESSCTVILDTLKQQYKQKPILINEHSKFHKRHQKSGEPVKDYVASVRALVHN